MNIYINIYIYICVYFCVTKVLVTIDIVDIT